MDKKPYIRISQDIDVLYVDSDSCVDGNFV